MTQELWGLLVKVNKITLANLLPSPIIISLKGVVIYLSLSHSDTAEDGEHSSGDMKVHVALHWCLFMLKYV